MFFILLDPITDLDVKGSSSDTDELREQRLSALFNAVIKCVYHGEEGSERNKLRKNVALLITKSDSIPPLIRKENAASLIEKAAPKFYATVRDRSSNFGCFYISAVGGDNSNVDCMPSPPSPVAPEGYGELFNWLHEREQSAARRRIVMKILPLAVAMLVILAGRVGYEWWNLSVLNSPTASESSKIAASKKMFLLKKKARELLDGQIGNSLESMRNELETIRSFPDLNSMRTRVAKLSDYENHTQSHELALFLQKIDDRAERLHYDIIKGSTRPEDRIERFEKYRQEYPNGRYLKELDELVTGAHYQQDARVRQEINSVFPGQSERAWPDYLRKKATLVDKYRREHAKNELRGRMESASNFARLLADQRGYTVTLHFAEKLSSDVASSVIVTINGKEALDSGKQTHTRPNWDMDAPVTWSPGDKIALEWRYGGWWTDGPMAVLHSGSIDSLKILSGSVELTPAEKKGYLDSVQPPKVLFSIKGITDEMWRDFQEFIEPGGYWGK